MSVFAKEPCIFTKEPHFSAQEPYVAAKEPGIFSKEPCISTKELYFSAQERYVSATTQDNLRQAAHGGDQTFKYGVATTCRLLKIIGLFCKRAL